MKTHQKKLWNNTFCQKTCTRGNEIRWWSCVRHNAKYYKVFSSTEVIEKTQVFQIISSHASGVASRWVTFVSGFQSSELFLEYDQFMLIWQFSRSSFFLLFASWRPIQWRCISLSELFAKFNVFIGTYASTAQYIQNRCDYLWYTETIIRSQRWIDSRSS